MKYFVFSDESGSWSDSNAEYYVRSWIKITEGQHCLLERKVSHIKENGTKELKWDNFKRNVKRSDAYKDIFALDFTIFITISKTGTFLARQFKIIDTLENLQESDITGGTKLPQIKTALKSKIINSARMVLFLNYYERLHIENSIKALFQNQQELSAFNKGDVEYKVDTPQFLDKEWEDVAKQCGIKNIELVKHSEKRPGIELADLVAGCVGDMIKGDANAKTIYDTYIKPKMTDMNSRDIPNPNLIFYEDFDDVEKKKIDNLFRK